MMRLGIGTAQFGSRYGISNVQGQPSREEARKILRRACGLGIYDFDTSPAYGSSEKILGEGLVEPQARICTKLAKISSKPAGKDRKEFLEEVFAESLANLRRSSVDACLVHDLADLSDRSVASDIMEFFLKQKRNGRIRMAGVSLYHPSDLSLLPPSFDWDLFQIPISALNQTFVPHLADFRARGIAVHARSIFLQGLLLLEASIPPGLEALTPELMTFRAKAQQKKMTSMELCLASLKSWEEYVDCAFVGVNSMEELEEVRGVWDRVPHLESEEVSALASTQQGLLDPRKWPRVL